MKYYRLTLKEQEEDCLIVNHYELNGFDLRKLWCSEKIDVWNKEIKLFFDRKEGLILDYLPNVLSWLILSDKIVNVFNELKLKNIQVFPVTLYNRDNINKTLQYNVVNVLTIISAMNWDKSDYLTWEDSPKEIKIIKRLVMYKSAILEGVEIFNLSEAAPYIVVSEKLKSALEKYNITGVDFIPIDVV